MSSHSDQTGGAWRHLVFKDGPNGHIESHIVHAWLRSAVVDDLHARFPDDEIEKETPLRQAFIDLPGMVITTRPTETFTFLGLKLEIPCEDVSPYAYALMDALTDPDEAKHWRAGGGTRYTKLRGFHRILVLTWNQAQMLWKLMHAKAVECRKKAQTHDDAWQRGVRAGVQ